jgi:hypothetical protein
VAACYSATSRLRPTAGVVLTPTRKRPAARDNCTPPGCLFVMYARSAAHGMGETALRFPEASQQAGPFHQASESRFMSSGRYQRSRRSENRTLAVPLSARVARRHGVATRSQAYRLDRRAANCVLRLTKASSTRLVERQLLHGKACGTGRSVLWTARILPWSGFKTRSSPRFGAMK